MMTKAIRVHKVGGPEALVYESVDVPAPGPGEVRIRQHAVGLNFIDVYYRTGLYKAPGLPFIAGNEASGEVVAVGAGVTNFHPGDRVAYYHNLGAYTGERNIPWEKLVKLPDHITYEQGAVLMLKGLTVWYLLHKTFKVEPHHRVLIHAAAGGIGLLACQWARALGAHVIGTVGSREKAELAEANGCDHVILYNEEDFVARVKQISRNEGCDVVYDGVGKATFRVAVLPETARHVRLLRQCLRSGAAILDRRAEQSRLAVRDAAQAQRLCRHAQGAAGGRRHAVRRRHQRQAARSDQPRLRAQGRRQGAYRSRKPQDHGGFDPEALRRRRAHPQYGDLSVRYRTVRILCPIVSAFAAHQVLRAATIRS